MLTLLYLNRKSHTRVHRAPYLDFAGFIETDLSTFAWAKGSYIEGCGIAQTENVVINGITVLKGDGIAH